MYDSRGGHGARLLVMDVEAQDMKFIFLHLGFGHFFYKWVLFSSFKIIGTPFFSSLARLLPPWGVYVCWLLF